MQTGKLKNKIEEIIYKYLDYPSHLIHNQSTKNIFTSDLNKILSEISKLEYFEFYECANALNQLIEISNIDKLLNTGIKFSFIANHFMINIKLCENEFEQINFYLKKTESLIENYLELNKNSFLKNLIPLNFNNFSKNEKTNLNEKLYYFMKYLEIMICSVSNLSRLLKHEEAFNKAEKCFKIIKVIKLIPSYSFPKCINFII